MNQELSTHCMETLMPLGGSVGAELRLGWFTCCSVLVSPTADVLQTQTNTGRIKKPNCGGKVAFVYKFT